MQKYTVSDGDLKLIADAIREKAGLSSSVRLTFPYDFIDNLSGVSMRRTNALIRRDELGLINDVIVQSVGDCAFYEARFQTDL